MSLLKKSFFCLSLRTGGFIIGWLGVIAVSLLAMYKTFHHFKIVNENAQCQGNLGATCHIDLENFMIMHGVFTMIIVVLFMTPSILIIVGIRKNNSRFLMPWLISISIYVILLVMLFCVLLPMKEFLDAFVTVVILVLTIYLYTCIYSLKLEMDEAERMVV